ncbi:MAG: sigma-70 family RNA polymerase sigma factor, partial [Planctomycetota bacterium]
KSCKDSCSARISRCSAQYSVPNMYLESALLPETRYSLIARLASNDDVETWQEFTQTYGSAVLRFCRSKGLQDADAVEVCQDVLIAVHRIAPHWEPSGRAGSFRAWLFETARRHCLKSISRRCLMTSIESVEPDHFTDPQVPAIDLLVNRESSDQEAWTFYAAAGLVQSEVEERTWKAFWLTVIEGQAAKEVALTLDTSVGNVYAAKCRIMNRLKAIVSELSVRTHQSNGAGESESTAKEVGRQS